MHPFSRDAAVPGHGRSFETTWRFLRVLVIGWAALWQPKPGWGKDMPASRPATTQPAPASQSRPASQPASPAASQPARQPKKLHLEDDGLDDLQLLNLEVPAVVTAATRREQKLNSLPNAVSVVTKDDIRASGARNVTDALRLVPGMDVADISYGTVAAGPRGLHGFVGRNTLVLVDGRQIYDSMVGGTPWGSWPVALENIERIEVLRGPAGVTWGANAVNGVVNIVTKDPADQKGLTAIGTGGSRGVAKEYTGYGITVDKLRLRVSEEYERTDGFCKGGSIFQGLSDDYHAASGSAHAIYEATPNDTITISGGSAVSDNIYPTPPLGLFENGAKDGAQSSFLLGRWKHRIADDNKIEATAYVNDHWSCNGMQPMDYRYQQLAFQINHTFSPAENHTLTYGFDSRTDLLDTSNAYPFVTTKDFISTAIVGLYAEDEWRFAPKWALTLGGRIDYEFYGGFQPSARISLSRELGRDSLAYAAVSRAYQMPPVGLRFVEFPLLGGLTYLTSDRDMRSTSLIAYEAGYRTKLFDRLSMDVNLFWDNFDDFLVEKTALGPPSLIVKDIRNDASVSTYGLEWEGRYTVNDKLTLLGNYTLEVTDWQGPSTINDTDILPAPRHKFMTGARYSPWQDLHLSAHLYYVGATESPMPTDVLFFHNVAPYARLDLRAEYEFWKKHASAAVGVRNLLDPEHFEGASRFLNSAEVPRMVYGEIRVRLD